MFVFDVTDFDVTLTSIDSLVCSSANMSEIQTCAFIAVERIQSTPCIYEEILPALSDFYDVLCGSLHYI